MTAPLNAAPSGPLREIVLQNPVAEHFETFIVGNSVAWQVRALVEIEGVIDDPAVYAELVGEFHQHRAAYAYVDSRNFRDFIDPFAKRYVVQEGSATGQTLVLCGAGPTLRATAARYCAAADHVWGCNSALTWLLDHGHKVTHGFTVDQTAHMCAEWATTPDVEYLIASTVHPHLTQLLTARERNWRFFHNFVGIRKPPVSFHDANGVRQLIAYEDWLLSLLYPATVRAGSGLNAVTRALDVATFMGFDHITVLGADCCLQVKGRPRHDLPFGSKKHLKWLRSNTVMHADGGHALASEASPLTLGGYIDGRYWLTKADMVITAQWLMRMARSSAGRIELVGDTLPVALIEKDDDFLARLPSLTMSDGSAAPIPF